MPYRGKEKEKKKATFSKVEKPSHHYPGRSKTNRFKREGRGKTPRSHCTAGGGGQTFPGEKKKGPFLALERSFKQEKGKETTTLQRGKKGLLLGKKGGSTLRRVKLGREGSNPFPTGGGKKN